MRIRKHRHKQYNKNGLAYYRDPVRKILVQATPEELVRQDVVGSLTEIYGYSERLLATEYCIGQHSLRRAHVVVFLEEPDWRGMTLRRPFIVIECKSGETMITDGCVNQGAIYCTQLGAPFLVVTNGDESLVFVQEKGTHELKPIDDIPTYSQIRRKKWMPKLVPDRSGHIQPTMDQLGDRRWLRKQVRRVYSDWIVGVDT
jgi:hypothetical protein